jgi:uncharacterized protein YjbJ (UPF0337 family)
MTNRDSGHHQWIRVRAAARQRWGLLTDDDVESVRGNTERLISVLQSRYGFARVQALKELTAWRQVLSSGAAA